VIPLLPLTVSWLAGTVLVALDGRKPWVTAVAACTLAGVAAGDLALLAPYVTGHGEPFDVVTGRWPQGVGIRLQVDALTLFFSAIAAVVLLAVVVHERRATVRSRLFPALLLWLCAGLHGAFATADLFNFYVFFEVSVITSFALAAYGYGRPELRATFVYVAVNLLGSVVFLVGVAGIYFARGTLDMEQLAAAPAGAEANVVLPATLLFVALALKLGLFPFHGWIPVLYSHARPAVVAALSGALVHLGAYGILRLGFGVFDEVRALGASALISLGAVAAVYGAAVAVHRERPTEIGAYAAIVHSGYLVLALGIGGPAGVLAVLLLVASGSVDKAVMFLSLDGRDGRRSTAAFISAASTAGLPLTLGFLSKAQLFRASVEANAASVVVPALLLSSTLVLASVFRFWLRVRDGRGRPAFRGTTAVALALFGVGLGVLPEPVLAIAAHIEAVLLGGGS